MDGGEGGNPAGWINGIIVKEGVETAIEISTWVLDGFIQTAVHRSRPLSYSLALSGVGVTKTNAIAFPSLYTVSPTYACMRRGSHHVRRDSNSIFATLAAEGLMADARAETSRMGRAA
jgi:hypothetical protein